MSAIAGCTFDTMRGTVLGPQTVVEPLERVGVDGAELRDVGIRERVSLLATTRTVAAAADATDLVTGYEGLVGSIATVVDPGGVSHRCLIVAVRSRIRRVALPTTNAQHTRRVSSRWVVRKLHVTGGA